ncbi:MAG: hypothetical protein IJ242_06080 [Clostridia bacterium]|nr:hypothetical protein [Clostridia bacterium]
MQKQERRGVYGRYTSAGAVYDEERDLYIARERAGGARDKLIDNAYATRSNDSPEPVLGIGTTNPAQGKAQKMGPLDHLLLAIRQDRVGATLCIFLFAILLGLGVIYLQKSGQVREDLKAIELYRSKEAYFQQENDKLEAALARARSDERIRNQAQNTLGMMRREKAEVRELYIQLPEETGNLQANTEEETKFELLDALLNLVGLLKL